MLNSLKREGTTSRNEASISLIIEKREGETRMYLRRVLLGVALGKSREGGAGSFREVAASGDRIRFWRREPGTRDGDFGGELPF